MNRRELVFVAGLSLLAIVPTANGQMPQPDAKGAAGLFEPTSASVEAKAEYQKAAVHWRNAFPGRAGIHLDRALQLDPEFGFARVVRGGVKPGLAASERQQEYERGLAALARAPAGEVLMGLAWREQFGGRTRISAALFEAATKLYPADAEVARAASVARRAGRPVADVIAEERRQIEQFPDNAMNHHNLAYTLYNSGDHTGGVSAIRDYLRLEPQHPNPHESLAEFLMRDGKNDEAMQSAERAIAVDPAFVSSWAVIADIKLKGADLAGARAQWAKGLQAALFPPDSVDMMHAVALSYLTENDSRTAMTRLGEVATVAESNRLAPRAALIHQQMAAIDAFYGEGRSVGGHLAKAAAIGGSNTAGLHVYSAIAYAAARQLDSARAAAQRFAAVATDANRATTNILNGFIALQANDAVAASTALAQANPNDVFGRELLAEAHLKQGRRAEAQALRDAVTKSATMVAGGRVLDLFILVAKQRAKTI